MGDRRSCSLLMEKSMRVARPVPCDRCCQAFVMSRAAKTFRVEDIDDDDDDT